MKCVFFKDHFKKLQEEMRGSLRLLHAAVWMMVTIWGVGVFINIYQNAYYSLAQHVMTFMEPILKKTAGLFFYNNMPKPKWRIQDCVAKLKENNTNKPEVQVTKFSKQEKQQLMFLTNYEGGISSCATLTMRNLPQGGNCWCVRMHSA